MGDADDRPISAKEAAELLGISERQVWRYKADGKLSAREGVLEVRQTQPGLLFSRAEVLKLKRQREGPASADNE
jgi:hypothetical protein